VIGDLSDHDVRAAAPASLPRRLVAFGVDYLVIAVYILTLWLASLGLGALGLGLEAAFADPLRGQLLGFGLLTLPVVLFFAVWESSAWQATPGKRALGLHVVHASGGRLPWSRSVIRSALKFLPWEVAHTCLWRIPGWPDAVEAVPSAVVAGLGMVWLLVALYLLLPVVSRTRQTPYDRVAGAFVTLRSGVRPGAEDRSHG